jgi:hypothetical protein
MITIFPKASRRTVKLAISTLAFRCKAVRRPGQRFNIQSDLLSGPFSIVFNISFAVNTGPPAALKSLAKSDKFPVSIWKIT